MDEEGKKEGRWKRMGKRWCDSLRVRKVCAGQAGGNEPAIMSRWKGGIR